MTVWLVLSSPHEGWGDIFQYLHHFITPRQNLSDPQKMTSLEMGKITLILPLASPIGLFQFVKYKIDNVSRILWYTSLFKCFIHHLKESWNFSHTRIFLTFSLSLSLSLSLSVYYMSITSVPSDRHIPFYQFAEQYQYFGSVPSDRPSSLFLFTSTYLDGDIRTSYKVSFWSNRSLSIKIQWLDGRAIFIFQDFMMKSPLIPAHFLDCSNHCWKAMA